ncbi:hypothetical protein Poli38472_012730 [Pythium oligandrum]|uniref:AAA+ ATPase domain-containing protein n=1 Tax=Pythium oligandrum TaxID=41045 RepID=A0A8K1CDQ4_PYTOL|nr:hypothetical protein Poli38472_012730 [Pythium oligandrum]|eukprot:TMW61539.1 hypothetical protein Poli38472_012730 [Pythium oligandrum]
MTKKKKTTPTSSATSTSTSSPPPQPPPPPAEPQWRYFANGRDQAAIKELTTLLSTKTVVGVHWHVQDATLVTLTLAWHKTLKQPPWIFHLASMKSALVQELLTIIFVNSRATKIVHALHGAATALNRALSGMADDGVTSPSASPLLSSNILDLELFYEHHVNPSIRNASALMIGQHCVNKVNLLFKETLMKHVERGCDALSHPEVPGSKVLGFAVDSAQLYLACYVQFIQPKYNNAERGEMYAMTKRRWQYAVETDGQRRIWFDQENDLRARSLECLWTPDDVHFIPSLQLESELASLLALLPSRFRDVITGIDDYQHRLVDVCLDVGRVPCVYTGPRQRFNLIPEQETKSEDIVVSLDELMDVLDALGGEDKIGDDNRAGIDRQLHRISVMRSKTQEIYGLTLRVGRTLMHASNMLLDLLLSEEHRQKSVLFLGRPGSGKTTMIRDVIRCISESGENVCIIDTSNEIGGDGLVPHQCIGWARRMMVRSLDEQASVMVECVQNHTVETLVVDEIGRKNEVLAAGTVRQRGPRLIASAHGDFRSLIRNSDLKGLIGGVQSVTVGDAEAKKKPGLGKVQSQRSGAPIFDVIVELDEVCRGRCRIIWNVANAVDDVLSGQPYAYETREQSTKYRGIQVLPRNAKQHQVKVGA